MNHMLSIEEGMILCFFKVIYMHLSDHSKNIYRTIFIKFEFEVLKIRQFFLLHDI